MVSIVFYGNIHIRQRQTSPVNLAFLLTFTLLAENKILLVTLCFVGKFPTLQENMKAVMAGEMEVVVGEEK